MAIEKKFVREQINRLRIKQFLHAETERAGFGGLDIQRTPMGTRVALTVERPGMVIGRRGATIQKLTSDLATQFDAENPQIEVIEAGRNANLNASIMAAKVAEALERGWHFRRAGHSTVRRIMESGAKGCIVILSGKLTGQRHRIEKFISGHIKYNGDTAIQLMDVGYSQCKKKLGTIGCTVKIMGPDARLPDEVTVYAPGEKDAPPAPAPRAAPRSERAEGAAPAKPDTAGKPIDGEATRPATETPPPSEEKPRRSRRREPMPMPTEADLAEAKALAEKRAAEAKGGKPAAGSEAEAPARAEAPAKAEAKAEAPATEAPAEAEPAAEAPAAKPETSGMDGQAEKAAEHQSAPAPASTTDAAGAPPAAETKAATDKTDSPSSKKTTKKGPAESADASAPAAATDSDAGSEGAKASKADTSKDTPKEADA